MSGQKRSNGRFRRRIRLDDPVAPEAVPGTPQDDPDDEPPADDDTDESEGGGDDGEG